MQAEKIKTMCVYLAASANGLFKIGFTSDASARVKGMACYGYGECKLLHTIPSTRHRWLEKRLHGTFKHRRVSGEWFRLTEDEVAIFESIPKADCENDLPVSANAMYLANYCESPTYGRLLRKAREFAGMSLRDVASGIGGHLSHETIRAYESGTIPRLDHARILATFFGTTVDELWPPGGSK